MEKRRNTHNIFPTWPLIPALCDVFYFSFSCITFSHNTILNFYVSTWQKLRFVSFLFSTLIKTASNHIFMCQERRKSLVFVSKNFMFHMRWKYIFYILYFCQRKYDIIFHDIAFYAFSLRFLHSLLISRTQKVLFHFLMHGKSNGSRHFYAPSIQHQINMKFMLRRLPL